MPKAAPLDQFPADLARGEDAEQREAGSISVPVSSGGDCAHGWGDGNRSENQGRGWSAFISDAVVTDLSETNSTT